MNGKGDRPRPVDKDKYERNYERIFLSRSHVAPVSPEIAEDGKLWGHIVKRKMAEMAERLDREIMADGEAKK